MTERTTPPRRLLKARARRTFFRFLRVCLACTMLLCALTLLIQIFSLLNGGALFYTFMDQRQFPMDTGIWKADADAMTSLLATMDLAELGSMGGLVFASRLDGLGLVLVLPVAWKQLLHMLIVQVIALLLSAPLQCGVLGQYRSVLEGRPRPLRSLLRWYTDLRLAAKALAVEAALTAWRFLTIVLCTLPGLACVVAGNEMGNLLLVLLSVPLTLSGLLLGYYLYLILVPGLYVLAGTPELSVAQAFSKGMGLLAGRQTEFLLLNLSFLPWRLVSLFFRGIPDLFVIPYAAMSSFLFLDPPPEPDEGPIPWQAPPQAP